jgi:RHS repeat-associated protein
LRRLTFLFAFLFLFGGFCLPGAGLEPSMTVVANGITLPSARLHLNEEYASSLQKDPEYQSEQALTGAPVRMCIIKSAPGTGTDYQYHVSSTQAPLVSSNTAGFQAKVFDLASGCYLTGPRLYDNRYGRFLTPDPSGPWGDPASMGNPYTYGGGNPALMTDLNGARASVKELLKFSLGLGLCAVLQGGGLMGTSGDPTVELGAKINTAVSIGTDLLNLPSRLVNFMVTGGRRADWYEPVKDPFGETGAILQYGKDVAGIGEMAGSRSAQKYADIQGEVAMWVLPGGAAAKGVFSKSSLPKRPRLNSFRSWFDGLDLSVDFG